MNNLHQANSLRASAARHGPPGGQFVSNGESADDALADRRQKIEDAFAYYVECVRRRDNGIGRSSIVAPEAIQTGVRVERRCKGKRSLRRPVGLTAGETRLNRLPEHGSIETERLPRAPRMSWKSFMRLFWRPNCTMASNFSGDAGYTRIRPAPRERPCHQGALGIGRPPVQGQRCRRIRCPPEPESWRSPAGWSA